MKKITIILFMCTITVAGTWANELYTLNRQVIYDILKAINSKQTYPGRPKTEELEPFRSLSKKIFASGDSSYIPYFNSLVISMIREGVDDPIRESKGGYSYNGSTNIFRHSDIATDITSGRETDVYRIVSIYIAVLTNHADPSMRKRAYSTIMYGDETIANQLFLHEEAFISALKEFWSNHKK